MHLKSITLKGFKSFPDRTRLEFAPGVSVVVGPNGSGKSNVTDAVLWAMGEQSPVAVRGQSMQDVIFGGAPGRQAAKSAEVEIVLDNSDGTLAFGLPEISILRRLDRNGEGEYRIAGARCRLVDVIELLSDTGLGKEMHSVISQGRVESIVTSKPRDRRLLIEEAAGLGKHRKRRRRAQLKLARTLDNLDRALDVEREARSRLRPLKRQAEAAELHARLERQSLEARWELARDDARAQRQATAEADASAAGARGQLTSLEGEMATVSRRREAAEEALAQRSAQREELSRRLFAARAAGERVGYRTEAVRAAVLATEERLSGAYEALEVLRAQAEADDAPNLEAAARVTALETSLAVLEQDRVAELERDLAALETRRGRAAVELETRSQAHEAGRTAREALDAAVEAVRQELRSAERSVETARREAARVGGQLAAVNQFLRAHAGAAGGTAALAATLQVEPGYELALAAALDGRLGAAVVPDRAAGSMLLDRAGRDGGRALVAGEVLGAPGKPGERPVPFAEHELAPGLFTISIDPQHAMEEYLRIKAGPLGHVLGSSKLFHAFAMATPGMRELLTIGKVWELAQLQRKTRGAAAYDLVVVDAPASGHGVGILRTPRTFAEIARVGPIAHQGRAIADTIADPEFTAVIAVATPEEMAVNEALTLRDALASDGLALHDVVVNAVYPSRFDADEIAQLRETAEDADSQLARAAIRAALSECARVDNQRRQLDRLAAGLTERVIELPFLFVEHLGRDELGRLADLLGAGLAGRQPVAPAPADATAAARSGTATAAEEVT